MIERYKSCLIVKDFNQITGLDYLKIFNLVVKMTTIRLLISISALRNWFLHQLNFTATFLYGDLDEEDCMIFPLL